MAWLVYVTDCLIFGSLLLFGSGALLIADLWFPRRKK